MYNSNPDSIPTVKITYIHQDFHRDLSPNTPTIIIKRVTTRYTNMEVTNNINNSDMAFFINWHG